MSPARSRSLWSQSYKKRTAATSLARASTGLWTIGSSSLASYHAISRASMFPLLALMDHRKPSFSVNMPPGMRETSRSAKHFASKGVLAVGMSSVRGEWSHQEKDRAKRLHHVHGAAERLHVNHVGGGRRKATESRDPYHGAVNCIHPGAFTDACS